MELDACCEWLDDTDCEDPAAALQEASLRLRWHRRPKPPSLKKQALAALQQVGNCEEIDNATFETIRRAMEAL